MKTSQLKKIAGALAIAGFAASANAAILTQEKEYGSLVDPKSFASFNEVLTFFKFDTNLGTLNSVRVEMDIDVAGGTLAADNDGTNPANIVGELGASGKLTGGVPLVNQGFQNVLGASGVKHTTLGNFNLAPDDGDTEVGGTSMFSASGTDYGFFNGTAGGDSGGDFIASQAIGQYQSNGASTFDLTAKITGINNVGGSAVQGQFDPVAAEGRVRVIYDYNAVTASAPSLAPLLGLGLIGLFAARRRVGQE